MSLRNALLLGNEIIKLALLGDYLSTGSFHLALDPVFLAYQENSNNALGRMFNSIVTNKIRDPQVIEDVQQLANHEKEKELNPIKK